MNLKAESAKSQLNYLWWVLEPILFIAIYFLVFDVFLTSGTDNFVAFLLCGQIPFFWFSRTVNNASNAIVAGAGLMNQIAISKVFFPVVVIGQDVVKALVLFLLMLSVMWMLGFTPALTWLYIVPIAFMQLCFIASCAIFFAGLVPFLPDLKFIINTFTVLIMFASGIFYDPSQFLSPDHRSLFLLNPLASAINMYREVIMVGHSPDIGMLIVQSLSCMFMVTLAILFVRRFDHYYPRLVLQ